MKCKIIAALLAAIMLISIPISAFAEEKPEQSSPVDTIEIRTEEEFLTFASNCVLDNWSQNKLVELKSDLNLENMDVLPVPTFGGIFDGGGFSISGLDITQAVTPAGLFAYLQPTAVVKNLCVRGKVTPDGDCGATGGIAGENHGRIESCSFNGVITGKTNTGAIAGSNYGTIQNCTADGSITGSNRTGGICGYNDGQMIACKNRASVNTDSVDPTLNPTKLDLDFTLDFSRISNADITDAASDTGGIAGYSSGSILSCENMGSIGYPHIGYNLGGIAGRNCGFMENCENEGAIFGRKDVGGIVGQIEPQILTVLSPDYLETLSKQFENLGGLVSSAGNDGAEMGGEVQDSIAVISGYQSAAQSAVGDLLSSAGDGELNEGALSDLQSAVQGMVNASGDLRSDIGDGVEVLSRDISAISGQISAISRTFALATEDAKKDTITDLSDVDVDGITEGRVLDCINTGSVEADLNVGGITGTMGVESTADPEDDMPEGSLTQRRRYEMKAIVDSCENVGTVTGKRSYVGGICGRMDLGLITQCRGYGRISSEDGDYIGGIAGLTGGKVRDCFAKCTLSGNNYVGGIVGSGIASDYHGDSSIVTGCYSMVDIPESKQYAGAVSGAYAGVFVGNYFVSDTLAGIDRVSYKALAEPVSYDKMQTMRELPESLQQLTLRFVADGQTIKTVSFHYGDSFEDSDFPEIPQKEGYYACWNIRDLTNLRFDTVAEAAYLPYITALDSADCRADGRPVFFVQGQFQEKDSLELAPGKTEFLPGANETLLEQWCLSVPADGLAAHTFRYLPEQEKVQLYLLKSGIWSRIQPETLGTYLTFDASGAEVEIAVAAADSTGRAHMLIMAGLLALLLLMAVFFLRRLKAVRRQRKANQSSSKKKSWIVWISAIILLVAAAIAAWMYMPKPEVVELVHIYDVIKDYSQQPEQKMKLTVKAQIENKDTDFSADLDITKIADHTVSVVTENGRSLYYSDGIVFVENGDAFRLNSAAPDYSGLMAQVLELSKMVQIDSDDGIYTITADGSQAATIARLLMPSVCDLLPDAMRLEVEIKTEEDALTQIQISGAGNLTDSVRTPFSLSAVVDILQPEHVQVPEAVTQKILAGNIQAQDIFSDELVQLIHAWAQFRDREFCEAQVQLTADVGPLAVDDSFLCYQWKIGETCIYGSDKTGEMLYFGENKVCNADGREVYVPNKADEMDISNLPDVLYRTFRNAQYKCQQEEQATVYSVALQPAGMQELTEAILPKTQGMDISYSQGSIRLILENGEIQSIQISCGGSAKVAVVRADVGLELNITLLPDAQAQELPEAVCNRLTA